MHISFFSFPSHISSFLPFSLPFSLLFSLPISFLPSFLSFWLSVIPLFIFSFIINFIFSIKLIIFYFPSFLPLFTISFCPHFLHHSSLFIWIIVFFIFNTFLHNTNLIIKLNWQFFQIWSSWIIYCQDNLLFIDTKAKLTILHSYAISISQMQQRTKLWTIIQHIINTSTI